MAKVNLTICDICGDRSKDAKPYTLKVDGETIAADLCDDDGKPILTLVGKLKAKPIQRRPGRRPVATIEQIEASKKQS